MKKYYEDDCENLTSGGSNLELQLQNYIYIYIYIYVFLFPSGYFHTTPKPSGKWKKKRVFACSFMSQTLKNYFGQVIKSLK